MMLSARLLMCFWVALRKESVDRNSEIAKEYIRVVQSLSARRAWIEILAFGGATSPRWSLSARRAWIEIAFHKQVMGSFQGRSPQGERG